MPFPRFHGHSINYLRKCSIIHLELSSSDSPAVPPLHLPESNRDTMCWSLMRIVWAVYHRPASGSAGIVGASVPGKGGVPPVGLKVPPARAIPVATPHILYSLDCSRSIYKWYKAIANWSAAFIGTFVLRGGGIDGPKVHSLASQRHWGSCVLSIFQIKGYEIDHWL